LHKIQLVNLDEDMSRPNCVTSDISGHCGKNDCDVNDTSTDCPETGTFWHVDITLTF